MSSLGNEQLEELQNDLQQLELSLLEVLQNTESGAKPVMLRDNIGRLSRMDEMHNQSILKANRNVLRNRLKGVKIARAKFSQDLYGYCEECDELISFPRLKAYPDAGHCISCQSAAEKSS